MDFIIISLLTSVPLAECLIKKTLETRELHIALDTNGHFVDPSKIPSCCNGEKILLETYQYEYADCDYIDECVFSNKEQLLPREKLRLHEMCSFQDICRNFSFISRTSLQKSRTNAVLVKYQCIDPRTNIVDICETQAVTFNDTFYLTINMKEVSRYKYCQCTIQNGWFALSMQDVRLKITGKNNCSSARLHVNKREISCKPNKVDFDSKFGILFNPRMKNAYIGVSYSSDDDKPEMVMLQGKPKETVSVLCGSSSSQTQANADRQKRKRTLISQISTTSDIQDLASEVSSDRPGITTTTAETTEIYSNYTPISSDTDCFLGLYRLNYSCISSCPDNYYNFTEPVEVPTNMNRRVIQMRGICSKCNETCLTCDGPHVSNCIKCNDGYEKRDGICKKKEGAKNTSSAHVPESWWYGIAIGFICLISVITIIILLCKHHPSLFKRRVCQNESQSKTKETYNPVSQEDNNENVNGGHGALPKTNDYKKKGPRKSRNKSQKR